MCLHTDWWTIWSSHSKNSARTGKSCAPQMMQRVLYKLLKKAGAMFQIAVSRCVKHIALQDRTTWPGVNLHVIIFVSCQYHTNTSTLRTAGWKSGSARVRLHLPGSAGRFCTGHHIGLRKSWESWTAAEDSCSPPPWNHSTYTFKTFLLDCITTVAPKFSWVLRKGVRKTFHPQKWDNMRHWNVFPH